MDIIEVAVLHDHVVRLCFADGVEKTVDLSPYLHGPVFEAIRDDPADSLPSRSTRTRARSSGRTAPTWLRTYFTRGAALLGWSQNPGRTEHRSIERAAHSMSEMTRSPRKGPLTCDFSGAEGGIETPTPLRALALKVINRPPGPSRPLTCTFVGAAVRPVASRPSRPGS